MLSISSHAAARDSDPLRVIAPLNSSCRHVELPALAITDDSSPRFRRRGLRLPEVLFITGLSKSHWYAMANPKYPAYNPRAPKSFKLGNSPNSPTLWWEHEVVEFMELSAREARGPQEDSREQ